MTVLVAVFNKEAIALAADSAVTSTNGGGQTKIFDTTKVFALSKTDPVGIMVYSSAELMGAHVETLIKVFRQKLSVDAPAGFKTLKEYYDCFIEFLSNDVDLFTPEFRIWHCERVARAYFKVDPYVKTVNALVLSYGV